MFRLGDFRRGSFAGSSGDSRSMILRGSDLDMSLNCEAAARGKPPNLREEINDRASCILVVILVLTLAWLWFWLWLWLGLWLWLWLWLWMWMCYYTLWLVAVTITMVCYYTFGI